MSDNTTEIERRAERLAHAIYGTIIISALVVALGRDAHDADEVLAALLGTAFVLFVAHVYSRMLARRVTREQGAAPHEEIVAVLVDNLPLAFAVVVPGLLFALAAGGAISLEAAYWTAVAYALASLVGLGLFYGRRTHHGWPASIGFGAASAGLTALIILLEATVD